MSTRTMSSAEWLTHLLRLRPDLARLIVRRGLVVDGERRFPPAPFVVVPNDFDPALSRRKKKQP